MSICSKVRFASRHLSHWIQETYYAVGQQIGERLEALSDGLAEQRYRSEIRSEPPRSAAIPTLPKIPFPKYRLINGHKYER